MYGRTDVQTYGCTDVRTDGHVTITSQPNFLGLIGYHISLAMELRCSAIIIIIQLSTHVYESRSNSDEKKISVGTRVKLVSLRVHQSRRELLKSTASFTVFLPGCLLSQDEFVWISGQFLVAVLMASSRRKTVSSLF